MWDPLTNDLTRCNSFLVLEVLLDGIKCLVGDSLSYYIVAPFRYHIYVCVYMINIYFKYIIYKNKYIYSVPKKEKRKKYVLWKKLSNWEEGAERN